MIILSIIVIPNIKINGAYSAKWAEAWKTHQFTLFLWNIEPTTSHGPGVLLLCSLSDCHPSHSVYYSPESIRVCILVHNTGIYIDSEKDPRVLLCSQGYKISQHIRCAGE